MALTTRIATGADVEAMATLHLASFSPDEHLGALLGPGFVRASYHWHVSDDAAYVIVAELDGKLVGLLGMCDGPFTTRMMRGCIPAFLGVFARRPWLVLDRRLWKRLARAKASAEWVSRFCSTDGVAQMTIGAVDASARGHSVFSSLIRRCEDVSRSRGIGAVRAGVYRSNEPCRRAFVKSGWVEVPALCSQDTVFFVRVFSADLLQSFPELAAAGVVVT
jgi:GNAT superfamily N-acetyltransferase